MPLDPASTRKIKDVIRLLSQSRYDDPAVSSSIEILKDLIVVAPAKEPSQKPEKPEKPLISCFGFKITDTEHLSRIKYARIIGGADYEVEHTLVLRIVGPKGAIGEVLWKPPHSAWFKRGERKHYPAQTFFVPGAFDSRLFWGSRETFDLFEAAANAKNVRLNREILQKSLAEVEAIFEHPEGCTCLMDAVGTNTSGTNIVRVNTRKK